MKLYTHHRFEVGNISLQGALHIDKNLPMQDSSCSFCDGGISFIAVSDGHGSQIHFRSQIGSTIAVEIAKGVILDYFYKNKLSFYNLIETKSPKIDTISLELQNKIFYLWSRKVLEDIKHNSFENDELYQTLSREEKLKIEHNPLTVYGCTLQCAFSCDKFSYYLKLGDGNIITIDRYGKPIQFNELEDDCNILNRTASLCSTDYITRFKFYVLNHHNYKPIAILIFSDGVINSLATPEMLDTFSLNFLKYINKNGYEQAKNSFKNALNKCSKSGNGDDVSCAYMVNKNKVNKIK